MRIHPHISSTVLACMPFFLLSPLTAQVTMPGPGAQWNMTASGGDPFGDPCFYYINYSISVSTDSVVDGLTYTLLTMERTTSYTKNSITNQICTSDTVNLSFGTIGGLRAADAKIYFREFNNGLFDLLGSGIPDDAELLLYDFSASVGDIIPVTKLDGAHTFDSVIVVDTIILDDGLQRKLIQVENNITGSATYYEGIGDAMYGLFGSLQYLPFESAITLNCYKEDDLYLIGTIQCDLFDPMVGINEEQMLKDAYIWPSPVTNQFYFSLPSIQCTIALYNVNGMEVGRTYVESNTGFVDVSELPAGIYVVHIQNADGKSFTQKMIKQ